MNQETIKTHLAGLICEAMYMERAELEDDELFSDFGLESTTLVKILAKLNGQYKSQVKVEEIVAHQTLNDASAYIFKQINN